MGRRELLKCWGLCAGVTLAAWAASQRVVGDRVPEPIPTTVTALAQRPMDFAGKVVSVKSRIIFGRGFLILTQGDYRILDSEPGSSEVKPKPPFDLIDDANWQKLNEAVLPQPPPRRQEQVIAIVEGRFDSAAVSWKRRFLRIRSGFGHLGLYDHRLVIHRVLSVELESEGKP